MDLHEIQELANLVKDIDLHELEIERGDMRLKIVNQEGGHLPLHEIGAAAHKDFPHHEMPLETPEAQHPKPEKDEIGCYIIKSPIVGTFYSAPSPESPDFVSVGVPVDINSTVCIIEAMKVMNEIQAEVKGIVVEVLAQNGQPIEFGQPLFKVKKS